MFAANAEPLTDCKYAVGFEGAECDRSALSRFEEQTISLGRVKAWPVNDSSQFPCDDLGADLDLALGWPSLTWKGVFCKKSTSPGALGPDTGGEFRVSTVDLRSSDIAGPAAALICALGDLSLMHTLMLSKNPRLTGPLGECVSELANLRSLIADSAGLTGTMPSNLGQLSKLTVLDLTDNALTGTVPSELGSLALLGTLRLGSNRLTGTLPAAWQGMASLVDLRLSQNAGLSGSLPEEWEAMNKLRFAWLDGASLSGSLPAAWARWGELEHLYLFDNQLTGSLPAEWASLSSLQRLHAGGNNITGPLPESWGGLAFLAVLNLANNALSGTIPHSWGALASLETLTLSHNNLAAGGGGALAEGSPWMAPLPMAWAPLGFFSTHWWFPARSPELKIWFRNVTATRSVLPKLKQLDLGGNPLNAPADDVLRCLCALQSLAALRLYNAGLYGPVGEGFNYYEYKVDRPVRHFGFSGLGSLDLSGNAVTEVYDALPSSLLTVNLMNNQLTGDTLRWTRLNAPVPVVAIQGNPHDAVAHALPSFLQVDASAQEAFPERNLVCRKVKGKEVSLTYTVDPWYDGYERCVCFKGFGSELGKGACAPCAPDSYRGDSWDTPNCTACPPHTHTRPGTVGAESMESCLPDAGFRPVLDAKTLKFVGAEACAMGTTKALPGHSPCAPCEYGQYAVNATACASCPEDAECPNSILHIPENRWRRSSTDLRIYKCQPGRCMGEAYPYDDPGCRAGHSGALCSLCQDEYAMVGRSCRDCQTASAVREMAMVAVSVAACVLLFLLFTCWPFLKVKTRFRMRYPELSAHDPANAADAAGDDPGKEAPATREADAANVVGEAQVLHPANGLGGGGPGTAHASAPDSFHIVQAIKSMLVSTGVQARFLGVLQELKEKGFTLLSMAVEALAQVISYLQVMNTFTTIYDIDWPKLLMPLFDTFSSYFVLRLTSLPSLGCAVKDLSFYSTWVIWMCAPLAFFGFLAVLFHLAPVLMGRKDVEVFQNCVLKTVFLTTFLMYIPVSSMATSMFVCKDLYGVEYLSIALDERCWTSKHNAYVGLAAVFMLLYPLGIPVLYYTFLRRLQIPAVVEEKLARHMFYKIVMNYTTRATGGLCGDPETTKYHPQDVHTIYQAILVDKSALHAISKVGSESAMRQRSTPPIITAPLHSFTASPMASHSLMHTQSTESAAFLAGRSHLVPSIHTRMDSVDLSTPTTASGPLVGAGHGYPLGYSLGESEMYVEDDAGHVALEEMRHAEGTMPYYSHTDPQDPLSGADVEMTPAHQASRASGGECNHMSSKEMMYQLYVYARSHEPHLLDDINVAWSLARGVPSEEMEEFQKREKYALLNLSFIFAAYKPQYWWWECVECARKFLLTSAMLFISPGTPEQIIAGILVNAAMVCIYLIYLPMGSRLTLYVKVGLSMLTCYDLFVGLGYQLRVMDTEPPGWAVSALVMNIVTCAIPTVFALGVLIYTVLGELRFQRQMKEDEINEWFDDVDMDEIDFTDSEDVSDTAYL